MRSTASHPHHGGGTWQGFLIKVRRTGLGKGREDDYGKGRSGQGKPNSWRSRKGGPDWNGELEPGPLEVGFDYYFGIPIVNSYPPYIYVENRRVVGLDQDEPVGRMESRSLGKMEGGTPPGGTTTNSQQHSQREQSLC